MTDTDALDALNAAREAYRRAHPRRADAVDEAMARGATEEDSEAAVPAGHGEPDPAVAVSEVLLCAECKQPVDPYGQDVLREITGWSRHRDQGGQNHVRFRQETGRFMCARCATALKYGGNVGQGSLL